MIGGARSGDAGPHGQPYDGAHWLHEGAAEWAGVAFAAKHGWLDLRAAMASHMRVARRAVARARRRGAPEKWLTLRGMVTRRDEAAVVRAGFPYLEDAMVRLGCWAAAWLAHRTSCQAVLVDYYAGCARVGFERAFAESFGLGWAEFYDRFQAFAEGTEEEQLAVLPLVTPRGAGGGGQGQREGGGGRGPGCVGNCCLGCARARGRAGGGGSRGREGGIAG